MKAVDAIGFVGHQIHIARARETRLMFRWLGDLTGRSLLDVGGGDGYWAARAKRRGALAYSVDIDPRRLARGDRFTDKPILIRGDALGLPFKGGSFDAVMSVSSIEHFSSSETAIAEMARVLRPGGSLVLSADSLAGRERWPKLSAAHEDRYAVVEPLDRSKLETRLAAHGLDPLHFAHLFRRSWTNRLYLELSRHPLAWNAAALLLPLVALSDRRATSDSGSIVLVHARRYS